MKELLTDYGGRRWYNEDFLNLQALALSATQFLTNPGTNFIVSGCSLRVENVTNASGLQVCQVTVSDGYVFINNKVRHIEKQTVETGTIGYGGPFYFAEKNTQGPKIVYASGVMKDQYTEFGAELVLTAPAEGVGYVKLESVNDTSKSFANAFLGHYAVLKSQLNVDDILTKAGGQLKEAANLLIKGDTTETLITKDKVQAKNGTLSGKYLSDGTQSLSISNLFTILDGIGSDDTSLVDLLDNYLALSGGNMAADASITLLDTTSKIKTILSGIQAKFTNTETNKTLTITPEGITGDASSTLSDGTSSITITKLLTDIAKISNIPNTSGLLPKSGGSMDDSATLQFIKAIADGAYKTTIDSGSVSIEGNGTTNIVGSTVTTGNVNATNLKGTNLVADDNTSASIKSILTAFANALTTSGGTMLDAATLTCGSTSMTKNTVATSTLQGTTLSDGQGRSIAITTLISKLSSSSGASSTAATTTSLPITSKLIIASISANDSFSLASVPTGGTEIDVIVCNTGSSAITLTLPTSGDYINLSSDTYNLAAGEYVEVNAVSDGTKIYLRATY